MKGRVTTVGTHPGIKVSLLRRGAAIMAVAGVVLAAADAAGAQPQPTIGQVKHNPKPLCPQKPAENKPGPTKRPCFVIGSVTGFSAASTSAA